MYNFYLYEHGVFKMLSLLKSLDDNNHDHDEVNKDKKLKLILSCLDLCSKDYEFSHDFGISGGHTIIKKLKKKYNNNTNNNDDDDDDDNEILELIETIECNIINSGCTYPIIALTYQDNNNDNTDHDDVNIEYKPDIFHFNNLDTIFLKRVPKSMHGHGQVAVGYILWSGAIILSKWLHGNNHLLVDKDVLEIGAGIFFNFLFLLVVIMMKTILY
jgi:hypothetical protein